MNYMYIQFLLYTIYYILYKADFKNNKFNIIYYAQKTLPGLINCHGYCFFN